MVRVSLVTQMVKKLSVMQQTQAKSLGQDDSLEKECLLTPVFLPGEFHGQRREARQGTARGVTKSQTQLSHHHTHRCGSV